VASVLMGLVALLRLCFTQADEVCSALSMIILCGPKTQPPASSGCLLPWPGHNEDTVCISPESPGGNAGNKPCEGAELASCASQSVCLVRRSTCFLAASVEARLGPQRISTTMIGIPLY
jgi:hypothetical protein